MFIRHLFTSVIMHSSKTPTKKLRNPAADRNLQPIINVLQQVLCKTQPRKLLEISSGTGQHAAAIAEHFPNIVVQPTEYDAYMLNSIRAFNDDVSGKNIREPTIVDIQTPMEQWNRQLFDRDGQHEFDYMLNINMIHITPIACTHGLFRNATQLLKPNGLLITYGPYAVDGVLVPESNVNFDRHLRSQNPEWGVRDIRDLNKIAQQNGIEFERAFEMPANNKICLWRKSNG